VIISQHELGWYVITVKDDHATPGLDILHMCEDSDELGVTFKSTSPCPNCGEVMSTGEAFVVNALTLEGGLERGEDWAGFPDEIHKKALVSQVQEQDQIEWIKL